MSKIEYVNYWKKMKFNINYRNYYYNNKIIIQINLIEL